MEFEPIHSENLYAVRFEDKDLNEYSAAFELWEDLEYLSDFFERNYPLLNTEFWKKQGVDPNDTAALMQWVVDDATTLRKLIRQLAFNSAVEMQPDLNSYFEPLDGQYAFVHNLVPYKGYGTAHPTILRLYAIKLYSNCYIVVHGGIKLTAKISGTPELNQTLFKKIDRVMEFLNKNGIIDTNDLI